MINIWIVSQNDTKDDFTGIALSKGLAVIGTGVDYRKYKNQKYPRGSRLVVWRQGYDFVERIHRGDILVAKRKEGKDFKAFGVGKVKSECNYKKKGKRLTNDKKADGFFGNYYVVDWKRFKKGILIHAKQGPCYRAKHISLKNLEKQIQTIYPSFIAEKESYPGEDTDFAALDTRKPITVETKIMRIIRNTPQSIALKENYGNTCQLCGKKLCLGKREYYSETHHLRPLGRPHNGADHWNNMLVLCPNCHVLFDYGVADLSSIKLNHGVASENKRYYNKKLRVPAK